MTGHEVVHGGTGFDTLVLNFTNVAERALAGFYTVDADGGVSGQIGGSSGLEKVTYSSIERFEITGTFGADKIGGHNGDDILNGNSGNDQLFGGAGNDMLNGSSDDDQLHGGGGRDTMTGGSGRDTFHFASAADSAVGSADRILDFTPDQDLIDVSAIDANPSTPGNDAFVASRDGEFHGISGELRWYARDGSMSSRET